MNVKAKIVLLLVSIFAILSCDKNEVIKYDGKSILKIEREVIKFEDESTLNLSNSNRVWYLVRHAEKDTTMKENPELNPEGVARATKLAEIFKGSQLDALYTTLYSRCISTIDPLSQLKGMPMRTYAPGKLKSLIDTIQLQKDLNHILIVGHSNTIPATANIILGKQLFTTSIEEDVYDNFYIVAENQKDSVSNVYKLKY